MQNYERYIRRMAERGGDTAVYGDGAISHPLVCM
jgi:hypothetical protein